MANLANTVKPGEVDPTPEDGDTAWCRKISPAGLICTRRPHTRGQHVAGNGSGKVAGTWLDEELWVEDE